MHLDYNRVMRGYVTIHTHKYIRTLMNNVNFLSTVISGALKYSSLFLYQMWARATIDLQCEAFIKRLASPRSFPSPASRWKSEPGAVYGRHVSVSQEFAYPTTNHHLSWCIR